MAGKASHRALFSSSVFLNLSSSSAAWDMVFLSPAELLWPLMAASSAHRSFSSSTKDDFFKVLLALESDIFLSLSFPSPHWMADIRVVCSDVSIWTDFMITGLNFFTGPNRLTCWGSGRSLLAAAAANRGGSGFFARAGLPFGPTVSDLLCAGGGPCEGLEMAGTCLVVDCGAGGGGVIGVCCLGLGLLDPCCLLLLATVSESSDLELPPPPRRVELLL